MFSYEERIITFRDWPKKDKDFVKKLAVIGQYSTDSLTLSTTCFYCQHIHVGWTQEKVPLSEHFSDSSKCAIFRLTTKVARRTLSIKDNIQNKLQKREDVAEELIEKSFIQMNIIAQRDNFFCIKCGSTDNDHKCKTSRAQKYNPSMDIPSAQFYIKYLHGEFTDQITDYLNYTLVLETFQKTALEQLLKSFTTRSQFQSLENFLEDSSQKIFLELEKKMKKNEKDAFDSLYNESFMY